MKIGLSQRVLYHKGRAYDAIEQGWYSYLQDHTLTVVPNRSDQNFKKLAEEIDMLIVTGGDDSVVRRNTELKLAVEVMLLRKPILGICHGAFLMTDILGGHVDQIDGHTDTEHDVLYFGKVRQVNSYHNLCIQSPHRTATVLATDGQGHCEAWIDRNLAGVVWHPERMAEPWMPDEINDLLFKEIK